MRRALVGSALGLAVLALGLMAWPTRRTIGQTQGVYTENVTFRIDMNQASYRGPLNELYLLLDRAGGRNPLQEALRLTNIGGATWEVTASLAEGDYIYVFVANPTQYVNLSDPHLNPDDVPDSNFFNDPNPRFTGFGGQFGKDNIYQVRNPRRPKIDGASASPRAGSLISSLPVDLSVRVNLGTDGSPVDPSSVKIRYQREEPYGFAPGALEPPPINLVDVPGATFTNGQIVAQISEMPEGIRSIHIDVSNMDGLAADTLTVPVWMNAQNEPPVADAGPSRFGRVNAWIEIDGGMSDDPDRVGFSRFEWRKVSGPGNMSMRTISQEPDNGNGGQRQLNGIPTFDGDGNLVGDPLGQTGAVPQMRFDQPGDYVVGLTVTDREGLRSAEATTTVHVAGNIDSNSKVRLHAANRNGRLVLSASGSSVPGGTRFRFVADARNPMNLVGSGDGIEAETDLPPPGAYFFHGYAGDLGGTASYPAQLAIRVLEDGTVEDRDMARSSDYWREDGILYLLFIREFADSDGDGEGDLRGAIQRIPWLKRLGINAVWLMPVEPSGTTHGYSMDAFFAVHEDYGTVRDLEEFVEKAHDAGIRVVLDNVLNHTSPVHLWFEAAKNNPDAVTRDRFIYRPDGSYQFAFDFISLPDLNYNNPIVRKAAVDRATYWMDRGFDGFRCDIAGFTPPSIWRQVRREVMKKQADGFMLAEIIPPVPDYIEEQFDAIYDAWTYWEMRDGFGGNRPFSSLDTAIKASERFVQHAGNARIRERLDPEDLIQVRYLGNQDEDRFLLLAGRSEDRQRVAAAVLLSLPGTPLITYGDEVALVEGRGRMRFDANSDMLAHYRKYVRIRHGNPGLRGQSADNFGGTGNSFIRISSDNDLNAGQIMSFLRYGNNQTFVVLANRGPSPVIGTPVQYYVGNDILNRLPDGPVVMTNHAQPTDVLTVTKSQLSGGHTSQVGGHEVKVYQLGTVAIPDADRDDILDSFDGCVGVPNGDDLDDDFDGVPNACDQCVGTAPYTDVGVDGCERSAGAPKAHYAIDGKLDDEAYLVAEEGDLKMYASYNGKVLYVAMTSAQRGHDHVIYLQDGDTAIPLVSAAFQKQGLAGARFALIDEGRGDRAEWQGPWVGTVARGSNPLVLGVIESTINLTERFGSELPAKIAIAGVRYGAGPNQGIMAQVPAAVTANNDVTSDEFVEFDLVVPEIMPANNMPPRPDAGLPTSGADSGVDPADDLDGDGVPNGTDNCLTTANSNQLDNDGDGRGNACDACPLTEAGARIDADGCAVTGPGTIPGGFGQDGGPVQKESCGCATTSPNSWSNPVSAVWSTLFIGLLTLRLRRRQGRRR